MVLAIALSFSLIACGSEPQIDDDLPVIGGENKKADKEEKPAEVVIGEPVVSTETIPGYKTTEVTSMPDYLYETAEIGSPWRKVSKIASLGDTMYFVSRTEDNSCILTSFDTINQVWNTITNIDTEDAVVGGIGGMSVAENSIWILFGEGVRSGETPTGKEGYYLYHLNLESGESSIVPLGFWSLDKHYYIENIFALDDERAMICNGDFAWVVDAEANVLQNPDVHISGYRNEHRVNGRIFVWADGICELNVGEMSLGEPVADGESLYDSNAGHVLTSDSDSLYATDISTGNKEKLFDWLDVVLSSDDIYGVKGLENSQGDFYYFTNRLLKIEKAMVPQKKPLILACFGNSAEEGYENTLRGLSNNYGNGYTIDRQLKDAVIRFNNTDPEYKIQIKPVVFNSDAERDRILIELASNSDVDIIDTSILPESALGDGVLLDLLPYIDADENISRDDFIPALLKAMCKNGGLYEYVPAYTMLTVAMPESLYPGKENWTPEALKELIKQNQNGRLPMGRDILTYSFAWAATAEFMDWDSGTCRFDSPEFTAWLEILKMLPMENEDWSDGMPKGKKPFEITHDFAGVFGSLIEREIGEDYCVPGFPGAEGSGSYYIKMGTGIYMKRMGDDCKLLTCGNNTRLGIMASGENVDGAWRFMRTFMKGGRPKTLSQGIPTLKENFENSIALEREMAERFLKENPNMKFFDEHDEKMLRELVEDTDKMANTDPALVNTIISEMNAYIDGKGTAADCAAQIQSRVSIYMAEHS